MAQAGRQFARTSGDPTNISITRKENAMAEPMSEDAYFVERDRLEDEIEAAQMSNDFDKASRLYQRQLALEASRGNGPIIDGVRTA
jgi:hypothetical protein